MRICSDLRLAAFIVLVCLAAASTLAREAHEWVPLFDGKTLDGWKVSENAKAFMTKLYLMMDSTL